MFKGIDEQTKKEFEKHNREDSNCFAFSFADLELCRRYKKNDQKREKCRLLSNKLSQKLHQIYSEGKSGYIPKIKFIDFELKEKSCSLFPNEYDEQLWNYDWWLKLNKKDIQEKSNVLGNGILKLNFAVDYVPLGNCNEKEKESFCKRKGKQTSQARSSALTQINNTIKNGNIDFTTLKESMFFLGESYLQAWPNDCLYCPKEYEQNPEDVSKYHQTHINKCLWRPERINQFKESQIALIKKIIANFNNYKDKVIQEIIKYAQEQNLTQIELNNARPNWQNHLRQLTNREKIEDYQDQLEADIDQLAAAKNKSEQEGQQAEEQIRQKAQQEEAKLKKEQEQKEAEEKNKQEQEAKTQAEEQAKQQALTQQREQVISEITLALSQEPPLSNSELSPQYQNWEERINQLTDLLKMSNLQDRVLADIQARREEKISTQKTKENVDKIKTGTKAEQQQAWKDLENQETKKGYQENQEEINNLKKEQATEDPTKYAQEAHHRIENKLQENSLKVTDLTPDNQSAFQKLKEGQITDPSQLVETENNLKQNIYQVETQKKITDLTTRVNQVLQSKSKSQINALKKELLAFLSSSNIYYAAKKKEVEQLLEKLESFENSNTNQNNNATNSNSIPWKIIIPLLLIGILLAVGMLLLRAKRIARKIKN